MKRVILKISQIHSIYIIGSAIISSLCLFGLVQLSLPWYIAHFGEVEGPDMEELSTLMKFFTVSVFSPLLETWICQWIPIYLLCRIKKLPYWAIILISSLCFGLLHYYNLLYVLYGCIAGCILATSFLIFKEQSGYSRAFWLTALVHSLFNLTLFLFFEI
jgi:membrane protease YdiL (CAAX protease family)